MKVILGKSVKFRDGIESDATSLALFFDAAGRRIPAFFWSLYANEGHSLTSSDKELLTIFLTKIRSTEIN